MTHPVRKKIQEQLHASESYLKDRKFLFDLIEKYKATPREKTYELHDILTSHAIKQNWSRRKLDILLDEIIVEIKNNDEYSLDINNLLTNYLDALEGNVAPAAIIRLSHDPEDPDEFRGYVRRDEWWDKGYYDSEENDFK